MTLQAWELPAGMKYRRNPPNQSFSLVPRGYVVISVFLLLTWAWGFPKVASADDVGTFTKVIGQVDLKKSQGDQVLSVKTNTGAEEKDEINTKNLSRAELRFIDDSLLTVAPKSRITIEAYMFDREKGLRRAASKVTDGLVHGVVTQLFKAKESEYVIKTPTAILGIRGTDFYLIVTPKFTDVLVKKGMVYARNSSSKIAGEVLVRSRQASRIAADQVPAPPTAVTSATFQTLNTIMNIGLPAVIPVSATPGQLVTKIMETIPPSAATQPGTAPEPPPAEEPPPTQPAAETVPPAAEEPAPPAGEQPAQPPADPSPPPLGGGGGGGEPTPPPPPTSTAQ
jgi:hypothetical protein